MVSSGDVALAMLGGEFGIADTPTSQLLFAHPLYGVALIALESVLGTAAYGWLTIIGLMLASAVLGLARSRLRLGWMMLAASSMHQAALNTTNHSAFDSKRLSTSQTGRFSS